MLKSLHLKNWRSIRDASIEFTAPITVLIGANASGKTSILDALYFLQETMRHKQGLYQSIYRRQGSVKIKNMAATMEDNVIIEYRCKLGTADILTERYEIRSHSEAVFPLAVGYFLKVGKTPILDLPLSPNSSLTTTETDENYHLIDNNKVQAIEDATKRALQQQLIEFATTRWQLLGENFMPPLTASLSSMGDLFTIQHDASNMVFMVDNMKQMRPDLYEALQEDLRFLLGHVSHLATKRTEGEVQIAFHENKYPEKEAPTVSAGTARLLAVLVAVYALDILNPNMSGLVVIEEPETSLNPSLLRKFVELLRSYTEDSEKPRQFILTTHNPAFLNHFEPEEVRVVSRDEDGNTVINPIPDYVREIWLNEHDLGDAWLSNVFGGIAE